MSRKTQIPPTKKHFLKGINTEKTMKTKVYLPGNRYHRHLSGKKSKSKKNRNVSYILLPVAVTVHTVTGSINFPADIAGITAVAQNISAKSAVSTYVTLDPGVIPAFNLTIANYIAAPADAREGCFFLMNNEAKIILGIFQAKASAFPLTAIAILHSGGFNAVPIHGAHVAQFAGTCGALAGTVDMITAGGPQNMDHLHIWSVSLDGINWNIVRATNKSQVTLTGFAHAKDVYFKTQLSIKDVLQAESNIITVLVN